MVGQLGGSVLTDKAMECIYMLPPWLDLVLLTYFIIYATNVKIISQVNPTPSTEINIIRSKASKLKPNIQHPGKIKRKAVAKSAAILHNNHARHLLGSLQRGHGSLGGLPVWDRQSAFV